MSSWKRRHTAAADAEFDTGILRSRASFIASYNGRFDFEAGLDEVYARAGMVRPEDLRGALTVRAGGETDDNGLLQQVCDHIDMIDKLLASVAAGDVGPVVTLTFLTSSRLSLHQLRTGLLGRRLKHWDAFNLISNVRHNLQEIDLVMRRHDGLPLDEALHTRIGELTEISTDLTEQLIRLEASVKHLFDTEHETLELVPAH
jgi:hypothetical protein